MRSGLPLALLAIAATPPAYAQASGKEASDREAARAFWHYSNCVVKLAPDKVAELLISLHWDVRKDEAPQRFAQRYANCLAPGDIMRADHTLFRGALAGSYFLSRRGEPLPDYSTVPILFDQASLERTVTVDEKKRIVMLAFGECVFRSSPHDVRSLLATEPTKKAESEAVERLAPLLGHCLPADEGQEMRFSKVALRGFLGEAAYAVDNAFSLGQAPESVH